MIIDYYIDNTALAERATDISDGCEALLGTDTMRTDVRE